MKRQLVKTFFFFAFMFAVFTLTSCASLANKEELVNEPREMLQPGGIFEPGKYIEADGVQILYNGEAFICTNNRSDIVRILCSIVGTKKDGSYDIIQITSFAGIDETQYERDKAENGWAIKKQTNLIRPNETLTAYVDIFDFNKYDSDMPENDIDNDGYFDIVFTISPQEDEKTIMSSTSDYKTEVYKIKDK